MKTKQLLWMKVWGRKGMTTSLSLPLEGRGDSSCTPHLRSRTSPKQESWSGIWISGRQWWFSVHPTSQIKDESKAPAGIRISTFGKHPEWPLSVGFVVTGGTWTQGLAYVQQALNYWTELNAWFTLKSDYHQVKIFPLDYWDRIVL